MAIDKSVNQAPMGIDDMMAQAANMEPDIEIEIEDPEEVTINVGGLEIVLDPDDMGDDEEFGANLAEEMEEEHMDGDMKVKVMKVDSGDMRSVMDEILGHGSPKIGM